MEGDKDDSKKRKKDGEEETEEKDESKMNAAELAIYLEKKAKARAAKKKAEEEAAAERARRFSPIGELQRALETLEKATATHDGRKVSGVVRRVNLIRRRLPLAVLAEYLRVCVPDANKTKAVAASLLKRIADSSMEEENSDEIHEDDDEEEEEEAAKAKAAAEAGADGAAKKDADGDVEMGEVTRKRKEKEDAAKAAAAASAALARRRKRKEPVETATPEVAAYLHLLVALRALDKKFTAEAGELAARLVKQALKLNRRTLDHISARALFLFALTAERTNRVADVRPHLITMYRTACLRHDVPGQIVLTNAVLRSFLHDNLYQQANDFRLNTSFPVERAGSSQHARYLFYVGKILTIQLRYSKAEQHLSQALRKAPPAAESAVGFRQQAQKYHLIVQLLMGDIPDRSVFDRPDMKQALLPYFQLTRAVRVGDLATFQQAMQAHKAHFARDKTYALIVRLHHNVIKTGLRKINVAYSRISLADVAKKLRLESEASAEYIVAKAIHDRVIDAFIDHDQKFVYSHENRDVYSSEEPQRVFHKRIEFCLGVHNDAVKAMRYPDSVRQQQKEEAGNISDDEFDDEDE